MGEEEEEEGCRMERWERRRLVEGWESKWVGARRRRIVGKGMGEDNAKVNHKTLLEYSDEVNDGSCVD